MDDSAGSRDETDGAGPRSAPNDHTHRQDGVELSQRNEAVENLEGIDLDAASGASLAGPPRQEQEVTVARALIFPAVPIHHHNHHQHSHPNMSNNNNQAILRQQARPSTSGLLGTNLTRHVSAPSALGPPPPQPQPHALPAPQPALRPLGDMRAQDRGPAFLAAESPASIPERDVEANLIMPNPIAASGWTEVEISREGGGGGPPSTRSLHAAAVLNGVFLVFGGFDGTQRVNTFHAFSFAEKRWSPVMPAANSSPPPSPRDRHVAVAFGNSFWVHGGFDGTSRVSDFWAFDFSTMSWREVLASQGGPPTPRHSHSAVVHGNKMLLFGGYDGSYKADLHEFDFTLSRWSVVPAAGRKPRPRYRATCVVYKNWLILYGGHDGTRHLSDTNIFDIDTSTWHSIVTEGSVPTARDSHVSVVHGTSMFVFGGSSGTAMNDMHELHIPSNWNTPTKWRQVNTSRHAEPRHRFCHVGVVYAEKFFVFGGYDGGDRLNDFISFDFAVHDLSFEVPPSTLISDLRSMINDTTLSDITFIVEGQPIHAHKLMLMRCSYFQALFLGNMRESTMDTIRLEQVRYPIFMSILEYLYTDQLQVPFHSAMELFEAADLFCIPRLKTMCEKTMLQYISVENAASIFHAADMHSATALRQKTKKYILAHFEEISKSSCFEEMGRRNIDLVFELLHSR